MSERLLIIGGDAGGMSAASVARRRTDASDLEIVAFERGGYTSYSACGLPYFVAGDIDDIDRLVARTPEQHRDAGIDVRLRHEVVGIDTERQRVMVVDRDGDGREHAEPYDQLVIATGAVPVRPDLPGVDAVGVHGIQTIGDGIALRDDLSDRTRAVVVGGGYVGLEMAEALEKRGLQVTIVDAGEQPMSTMDPDMGAHVAEAIRGIGIDLRLGTRVTGFETDHDGRVTGVASDAGVIPADIVVLGIGVRPAGDLARDAGIAVGAHGGVLTDRRQSTSVDGVWAAGDCVESFHRITHERVAIPLGTHANKQGRVAGLNATGSYAAFPGVIGTAITKICEYEIGRTGLTEKEATRAGFGYETATIESTSRAAYYPGAQPITVKVLAEKNSGRLLGAQVIGREGAGKRIDVMATAIWNGMLAEDFGQVDLSYAPPLSPLWDPTLIAARAAASALLG